MSDEQTVPIHFVLGTGRCGSTLLHEALCRHPDVRFISNLDDRVRLPTPASRWSHQLHRLLPAAASRKGRLRFAPSEAYRVMEREVGTVLSVPGRDLVAADATPWLAARTKEFFRARATDGVLVHKWTGWPRARFLQEVFPTARFVNVVRDGRAVVNSWLQMPWWRGYEGPEHWQWGPLGDDEAERWARSGHSFPVLAALLWVRLMDAAEAAASALTPGTWIDVRYEDLVADPLRTMRSIHEFLGIGPADDGLERYDFSSARREAFRDDLGPDVVAEITDVSATHLARFGYPR